MKAKGKKAGEDRLNSLYFVGGSRRDWKEGICGKFGVQGNAELGGQAQSTYDV